MSVPEGNSRDGCSDSLTTVRLPSHDRIDASDTCSNKTLAGCNGLVSPVGDPQSKRRGCGQEDVRGSTIVGDDLLVWWVPIGRHDAGEIEELGRSSYSANVNPRDGGVVVIQAIEIEDHARFVLCMHQPMSDQASTEIIGRRGRANPPGERYAAATEVRDRVLDRDIRRVVTQRGATDHIEGIGAHTRIAERQTGMGQDPCPRQALRWIKADRSLPEAEREALSLFLKTVANATS